MQPPPFHVVSGLQRTSHGAMALALAAEFADVDLAAAQRSLEDLAWWLAPAARRPVDEQLGAVASLLADELEPRAARGATQLDDLLFDRVLAGGRGSPVACALVAVEAGRLAGIDLGLVASRDAVYVAHERARSSLLLVPAERWAIVDGWKLGDPSLAWQCPHEAAGIVLGMVLARAQRTGQVAKAVRAAELCLALPVDDHGSERLRMQLAKVRALLN